MNVLYWKLVYICMHGHHIWRYYSGKQVTLLLTKAYFINIRKALAISLILQPKRSQNIGILKILIFKTDFIGCEKGFC